MTTLDKTHKKFQRVADVRLPLLTAESQEGSGELRDDLSMGEAVAKGVVGNETLGYFMVRTW